MLSTEQLKAIKQVNVSVDAEKTKQRIKEDYSSAPKATRKAIESLSGQKRVSIYRAYQTGSVNARIVLALSQTLCVSPLYYTGEIDEKLPLAETTISGFLTAHGYDELAQAAHAEQTPKRRRRKAKEAAVSDVSSSEASDAPAEDIATSVEISIGYDEQIQAKMQTLTEDEAILLLRALLLRAEANADAAKAAEIVKLCLLS